MSVWTNFGGEFNFMSDHNIEDEIMETLGTPITFDEIWESYDGISRDRWLIPHGSEGSIQYHTKSFYSMKYNVWKTRLIISGNLRDYCVDRDGNKDTDITQWLLRLFVFKPCLDFDNYKYQKTGEAVYLKNVMRAVEDDGVESTYWLTDKLVKRIVCEYERNENGDLEYDKYGNLILDWDNVHMYKHDGTEWVLTSGGVCDYR